MLRHIKAQKRSTFFVEWLVARSYKTPEPITQFNPRKKHRSLQYQKDLEDFQSMTDDPVDIVSEGSIFWNPKVRKMMEDESIDTGKTSKKEWYERNYQLKVIIIKN